jgi:ABC-type amino acid transport substrate-binding protein
MRFSTFLLTLSLLAGSGAAADAGPKLRIATEGAYPPFNFLDASGQPAGFDVDIAKAICADMAGECSYVAVPWDDLLGGLEKGDYDLIVASMAHTPERAARVAFTDGYYRSHASFVGDPAKIEATTPDALAGLRIAVQRDTIQAQYARATYPRSEIVEGDDVPAALGMLVAGKADITLIDAINGLDWMQTPEGERFSYIGDPVTSDFLQSSARIAARKGDGELVARVNEAIKHLRLNGTYERINAAYFPFSIF